MSFANVTYKKSSRLIRGINKLIKVLLLVTGFLNEHNYEPYVYCQEILKPRIYVDRVFLQTEAM